MKSSSPWRPRIMRFARFCMVGLINTAVYYLFYRLFLFLLPYLAAHVLGWFVATLISFYLNAYFTFRTRPTFRRLLAFPMASLVNLGVSTVVSVILVSGLSVSNEWGTVAGGIVAVPFTFVAMRHIFASKSLSGKATKGG